MSWVAVGAAAITVVGGAISSNQANGAANRAASAQERAAQLSVDEQRRQFDLARQDQAPWLAAGTDALGRQTNFLNGDFSGFMNSPDYKYTLQEGIGTIDKSAASRGGLFGGAHSMDLTRFGQGLATQNANSYWSKLAGLSGTGQNSAQNLGALGANMATNIGNQYNNAGNARASAYQQIGNNNAQFAAGVAGAGNSLFQNYAAQRNGSNAYSNPGSYYNFGNNAPASTGGMYGGGFMDGYL